MIKLFKIKERQMGNITNLYGQSPSINHSAGELRLYKDFTELSLPRSCEISFPDGKEDFMNFEVTIKPDDGFYRGGVFVFRVVVGTRYPHYAPIVKCLTKVCHLYIDSDGNVFLNILHNDWEPVITISQVEDGIYRLFTATFTSSESNMLDLTMDEYGASTSGDKVHKPTTPKNVNLKALMSTFVPWITSIHFCCNAYLLYHLCFKFTLFVLKFRLCFPELFCIVYFDFPWFEKLFFVI
ncbi:hypothetical protein LXL04_008081 [Taraxacum kok-saghyz]